MIPMDNGPACGRWRLGRIIGRGAYGVVYAASSPEGDVAAVKVCTRGNADPDRFDRELRGAKLYRNISPSPGLVRVQELGECDWGFYLAMDLADDEFGARATETETYQPKTLARVIASEKALPLEVTLSLGIQLAQGLVTLQRHHLLHRDVKPGNVIYVHGSPALSDVGLLVEEAEATSSVGTPGYVPPENFTSASSDVFSLGQTLKAASFGRSVEDLALGPTLESDTSSPLFPAWWRILNKATSPDPACRYRSAKALLNDLKSLRRRWILATFIRPLVWFGLVAAISLLLSVSALLFQGKAMHEQENTARDEYIAQEVKQARDNARKAIESIIHSTSHDLP